MRPTLPEEPTVRGTKSDATSTTARASGAGTAPFRTASATTNRWTAPRSDWARRTGSVKVSPAAVATSANAGRTTAGPSPAARTRAARRTARRLPDVCCMRALLSRRAGWY